jgi:hypothetical protein
VHFSGDNFFCELLFITLTFDFTLTGMKLSTSFSLSLGFDNNRGILTRYHKIAEKLSKYFLKIKLSSYYRD